MIVQMAVTKIELADSTAEKFLEKEFFQHYRMYQLVKIYQYRKWYFNDLNVPKDAQLPGFWRRYYELGVPSRVTAKWRVRWIYTLWIYIFRWYKFRLTLQSLLTSNS